MTDQPRGMGDNNPPAHEAFSLAISDLFEEAKNHLDGNPIENQGQADDLGLILKGMKELLRDSEKSRKAEKQPFIDGGKDVDTRWKDVQSPAKLTIEEATKPLTVWREKVQAEKAAEAAQLREEAEKAKAAADNAREQSASLSDAQEAEELQKQAQIAERTANKIDRAPTGLRTSWDAQVLDYGLLLKWVKRNRADDLYEFLNTFAHRNVELAKAGNLPGVEAQEVKKAQ